MLIRVMLWHEKRDSELRSLKEIMSARENVNLLLLLLLASRTVIDLCQEIFSCTRGTPEPQECVLSPWKKPYTWRRRYMGEAEGMIKTGIFGHLQYVFRVPVQLDWLFELSFCFLSGTNKFKPTKPSCALRIAE